MKLRTWKYYINQGLRGIFKNGLMSFASIVIVSACIFIVILSLCIITNADYMLKQIESEIGVTLFLGEKPEQTDVDALIVELENMPEVSSVTFKSSEEALEDAKEMYTEELLDGLKDDNPLPRSLEIKLKDIKYQKSFIQKAEQLQVDFENRLFGVEDTDTPAEVSTTQQTEQTSTAQASTEQASEAATQAASQTSGTPQIGDADYEYQGIELISHAQQLTETLITLDTAFKLISVILVAILSIVSIGIIMNTIKLTVFIRKNEIGIMKYVGATDWFIRWPFIIEGLIIGLIGAIIPSVLCTLGYIKLYNFFNSDYTILKGIAQLKPAMDIFTVIIPIALLVGMLIGAIGSISSIRKHLNV
ncbi:MAG: permease-like cell division protein FtsX [Clostridia bacterium]|nr:permease-like cell division protein FtsX [Clostridia bacterium]